MVALSRIPSGVTTYDVDDGAVLFIERTRELLRLNQTGAVVWHGLGDGLSFRDIVECLFRTTGAPVEAIERDVAALVQQLESSAVSAQRQPVPPGNKTTVLESGAGTTVPVRRRSRALSTGGSGRADHQYRLADFCFQLKTAVRSIASEANRLFSHLPSPHGGAFGTIVEIVEDRDEWLLLYDGQTVDACSSASSIVPMLHANVLLTAYQSSNCMAALHAAAVTQGDKCVIMPGPSGSGKSTLTAALVASGFGYCADDLILLTDDPLRVRPVATSLGVKSGSWNILNRVFPELDQFPTHVRRDGKQIRYLSPPANSIAKTQDSYRAASLVFPVWFSGNTTALRKIGTGEALARLTVSGYDLPNGINRQIVSRLIGWASELPCFELRYDALEDAVRILSDLP